MGNSIAIKNREDFGELLRNIRERIKPKVSRDKMLEELTNLVFESLEDDNHPLNRLKADTELKTDKEKDEEEQVVSKRQIKPKNASEAPIRDRLPYTSSDIGKYERGESPILRPRVLLFIYYFRQKGKDAITVEEANKLIGYIPLPQGFHQLHEDEIKIIFGDKAISGQAPQSASTVIEANEETIATDPTAISVEEIKPEISETPIDDDSNVPDGSNQIAHPAPTEKQKPSIVSLPLPAQTKRVSVKWIILVLVVIILAAWQIYKPFRHFARVEATSTPTLTTSTQFQSHDLHIVSPGFQKNIYLIKGNGISKHHISDNLVVYGEISPGTEIAIALLKVIQVNPDSISAQAILVHPNLQIFPNLRVDDKLDYISTSELIPAEDYAVGYLLSPGRIRLRPNSGIQENSTLQALDLVLSGNTILDALPFDPPIEMRVISVGKGGVVAAVVLSTGSRWPVAGTIVNKEKP